MKEKLSLREIANWQLEVEHSEVDLPTIQRGLKLMTKHFFLKIVSTLLELQLHRILGDIKR